MRWSDTILACLSPREVLAGYRLCRREGCSVREALSMSATNVSWGFGPKGLNASLSERLERSLWIAEHPGCSRADVEAWEHERLMDLVERCRTMLGTIRSSRSAE